MKKTQGIKSIFIMPMDLIIVLLSAIFIVTASINIYSGGRSSSHFIVQGPENTWIFPINTFMEINVRGLIGETLVSIRGAEAGILSSPCTGKTCIAAGNIHRQGQWLSCLPNGVFVLIEGIQEEGMPDAIVY